MEIRVKRGKVGLSQKRMIWIRRVICMVGARVTVPVD